MKRLSLFILPIVMASAILLGLTVQARAFLLKGAPPPGCVGVAVTPASGIQNAVNANPAGTTFCLAAGTYTELHSCNNGNTCAVVPQNNDTFTGAGIGQTILNGQNSVYSGIGQYAEPHNGVTISGMTITNYAFADVWFGCGAAGTTVQNSEISFGGQIGINICVNGGLIQNNLIHDNGLNGISCINNVNLVVDNNDIYRNNTLMSNPNTGTGQAAGTKCNGGSYRFSNNLFHDNWGRSLWFDSQTTTVTVTSNEIGGTQLATGGTGGDALDFEITTPVFNATTLPQSTVSGNYIHDNAAGCIAAVNSGNVAITGNALSNCGNTGGVSPAYHIFDEGYRSDVPLCVSIGCIDINNTFSGNWVAVPSGGGLVVNASDDGTTIGAGSPVAANWKADNNTFSANTYYLVASGNNAFLNQSTLLTPAQWLSLSCCGGTPDSNSTFIYNGGTLPSGVGPRGGFVCQPGMGICP